MKAITYLLISTALSLPLQVTAKVADDAVKRFALITASNNGGDHRQTLRYAESDAIAFSKVFEEIGGVEPQNRMLLLSPNKHQFLDTLKQLRTHIEKDSGSNSRLELIFYYSGHSDEDGLMLFNEKLNYQILRNELQAINADVRVAILDSCQSGVFTRLKGGVKKTPFMVNNANNVKGNVFLSSSSANEAAQESDAIGGSFFTHHLISALRGASDISGDSQITLNEAYQYAFNETLAHTEKTLAGAQHAAYNIQLAGAGDLVLTDVQTATTSLIIPEQITGRIFIRSSSGRLTAELNKLNQSPMTIGLVPDIYQVTLKSNKTLFQDEVDLKTSKTATLDIEDFSPIEKIVHRTRGKTQGNKFNLFSRPFFSWKAKNITTISVGYESFSALYKSDGTTSSFEWGEYKDINERYEGYNINISRKFNTDYFLELGRHDFLL